MEYGARVLHTQTRHGEWIMSDYPIELITNYRAGKINRQQFTKQFSDWQKSHGINFDCKGYADKSGVYMTYRGIKAAIRNGLLCWKNNTAKTVFEFQRKVDFSKNDYPILTVDQQKTLFKIMRG